MAVFETLEALEVITGSKDKEAMLKGNLWDDELTYLLDAALNFNRKFFIKKLPELAEPVPCIGGHLPQFKNLLYRLETRQITGDAAKNEVKAVLDQCTFLERKWFSRVLLKDLRCGFGISTCNKAGFAIPEFEVMLAKDGKECKNIDKIITSGVWVSRKYDGYRCLAIVKHGEATLYSRNGKEYVNFPTIQKALKASCNAETTYIFDGEILSDDFQSIQRSAFASKRGTTVGDVIYRIFDCIDSVEWEKQSFKQLPSERFVNLTKFFTYNNIDSSLSMVEHVWSTNKEEILQLERDYIVEGYEGAMLLPEIPYYVGRKSNAMLKFKTMVTMDCEVVGVYQGTGKYAGSLGGLHLIQENGLRCDVGSGFDDTERRSIFNAPAAVCGRIAEIKYQNLSDDGILRFPIFLRWRDSGKDSGKI